MPDAKKWSVVATDSDFITTSTVFVPVPGVLLPLQVEQPTAAQFTAQATVLEGAPCEIGIRFDGRDIFTLGSVPEFPSAKMRALCMTASLAMAAGVHVVEMVFRVALPTNHGYPEGPREWSPRKKKILPVILLKNPTYPVCLMALTGWGF